MIKNMNNKTHVSGNNFNLLRLFAAFLVLYGHGHELNDAHLDTVLNHGFGVYVFFAISGYLIAISWSNDPHLLRYFWRRALRIFPALILVTLLTVFILGPLMSSLSYAEYFQHMGTYQYLQNIVLHIHYQLPGVFTNNPFPGSVNGSLWTLPIEFMLYISVAAAGLIFRIGKISSIVVLTLCLISNFYYDQLFSSTSIYSVSVKQIFLMGAFFWTGCAIYHWKISQYFSLNTFGVVLVCAVFLQQWPIFSALIVYLSVPFLVICFGSTDSGKLNFFNKADYSYGLYIYAFPVQQSLTYLFPDWSLTLSIGTCLILTTILSALSWHFVEKPILRFKPKRKVN